jgi:hypothetical protein
MAGQSSAKKKDATVSAKAAKSAALAVSKQTAATKLGKSPSAWEKGGKEWTRLLGHFGAVGHKR